jgi:signal peptidase II
VCDVQAARGKALTRGPAEVATPARPRRVGLLLLIAATVYVLDVVSKVTVVATLSHHRPVRLLGGIVSLHLYRNSGAAFSVGTSLTIVFTLIAASVIVFILRASRRLRSGPWAVTLGLLLGGATGNLTDRLLRSPGVFRGEVVDWIQVPHWPVFNLADSAIVCGGALAVVLATRGLRLDGRHAHVLAGPAGEHPDAQAGAPAGAAGDGQPAGYGEPAGDSQG